VSIDQDIVIVNEFTVRGVDGKGSRGSTPGAYVARYCLRDDAVEVVAPRRVERVDEYVTRYMLRESAVEVDGLDSRVDFLLGVDEHVGGVSFSLDSASLSDVEARELAVQAQEAFDGGGTVLKTVVSFSQDYLKRQGLVGEDVVVNRPGDYRYRVDTLKIRLGVMNGCKRLRAGFDDLRVIGAVQTDTEHVHVHLTMWDGGLSKKKRVRLDGSERGMLSRRELEDMRRGIDNFLDVNKKVAFLSASMDFERRNVKSFVERFVRDFGQDLAEVRLIESLLPLDKRRHRPKSHAKDMKRCNEVTREFVEKFLVESEAGRKVMASIDAYLVERRSREERSEVEWLKTEKTVLDRTVFSLMSSVYREVAAFRERGGVFSGLSEDFSGGVFSRRIAQSEVDVEEKAAGGEGDVGEVSSSWRVFQGYLARLAYHRKKRRFFEDAVADWEGFADEDKNRDVYDFYVGERDFHDGCARKYASLTGVVGVDVRKIRRVQSDLLAARDDVSRFNFVSRDGVVLRLREEFEVSGDEGLKVKGGEYVKSVYGLDYGERLVDKVESDVLREELESVVGLAQEAFDGVVAFYDVSFDEDGLMRCVDGDVARELALIDFHVSHNDAYDMGLVGEGEDIRLRVDWERFEDVRKVAYARAEAYAKAMRFFNRTGQSVSDFDETADDIDRQLHFVDGSGSVPNREVAFMASEQVSRFALKDIADLHSRLREELVQSTSEQNLSLFLD